jgi:hypothetical protein
VPLTERALCVLRLWNLLGDKRVKPSARTNISVSAKQAVQNGHWCGGIFCWKTKRVDQPLNNRLIRDTSLGTIIDKLLLSNSSVDPYHQGKCCDDTRGGQ